MSFVLVNLLDSQTCLDLKYDSSSEKFNDAPRVEPLLVEHLDNVITNIHDAFKEDPLQIYLTAGIKSSPLHASVRDRITKTIFKRQLKRNLAYTINAGDSVIMSTPPEGDMTKPSPVDRVLDSFVRIVAKMFNGIYREQAKRLKEFEKKANELTEVKLGPDAKKMFCVTLLATKPEQQGKGFGTALLNTILFSADIRGRSVYLFSSNVANVAYYESFGFVRTADVSLGDDNPKWDGPPVMVPLMVREARNNS